MNERIRELAEQAKAFIVESEHAKIAEVSEVSFSKYEDLELFAELIVRECIREIGFKSVELLDIDFYPHYQERLRKHFGVED